MAEGGWPDGCLRNDRATVNREQTCSRGPGRRAEKKLSIAVPRPRGVPQRGSKDGKGGEVGDSVAAK